MPSSALNPSDAHSNPQALLGTCRSYWAWPLSISADAITEASTEAAAGTQRIRLGSLCILDADPHPDWTVSQAINERMQALADLIGRTIEGLSVQHALRRDVAVRHAIDALLTPTAGPLSNVAQTPKTPGPPTRTASGMYSDTTSPPASRGRTPSMSAAYSAHVDAEVEARAVSSIVFRDAARMLRKHLDIDFALAIDLRDVSPDQPPTTGYPQRLLGRSIAANFDQTVNQALATAPGFGNLVKEVLRRYTTVRLSLCAA